MAELKIGRIITRVPVLNIAAEGELPAGSLTAEVYAGVADGLAAARAELDAMAPPEGTIPGPVEVRVHVDVWQVFE